MKKLTQSTSTDLPPAKLFLDDLEEIDKILKESCSSYTLTIDEYELDSINEIKEIEERQDFYDLKITLDEFYFILNIGQYWSYIISEDTLLCIGIIEKIKPIIQKRRKRRFFTLFYPLILNVLLLFSVAIDKYYIDIYSGLIEYIILGIMMLLNIIILIDIISTFRNTTNKFTVFTTKKSTEQTNYFTKNKDQIISNSISAVIGGIFATLFRFILDQYTP
jgi:hypothetical protein